MNISYTLNTWIAEPIAEDDVMDRTRVKWTNSSDGTWTASTGNWSISTTPSGIQACNESKIHNNIEKACFHGMKSAYRMLGLHTDTDSGFTMNPDAACQIATEVSLAYLEHEGEIYNRKESHDYYQDKIVPEGISNQSLIDRIRDKLGTEGTRRDLRILEAGLKRAWHQIDQKQKHADGCRTAIAAVEHFLDTEVDQ